MTGQGEFVSSSGLKKCVSASVNGCRQNESLIKTSHDLLRTRILDIKKS